MVYGDRLVVDENDNVLACVEFPSFRRCFYRFGRVLPQETGFFRRDLWNWANGLNEDLHISMDRDLWLRFMKISKIYHIPFIMGSWRQHASAKSFLAFGPQHANGKECEEKALVEAKHLTRIYRSKVFRRVGIKVDKLRTVAQLYSKKRKRERAAIYRLISEDKKRIAPNEALS